MGFERGTPIEGMPGYKLLSNGQIMYQNKIVKDPAIYEQAQQAGANVTMPRAHINKAVSGKGTPADTGAEDPPVPGAPGEDKQQGRNLGAAGTIGATAIGTAIGSMLGPGKDRSSDVEATDKANADLKRQASAQQQKDSQRARHSANVDTEGEYARQKQNDAYANYNSKLSQASATQGSQGVYEALSEGEANRQAIVQHADTQQGHGEDLSDAANFNLQEANTTEQEGRAATALQAQDAEGNAAIADLTTKPPDEGGEGPGEVGPDGEVPSGGELTPAAPTVDPELAQAKNLDLTKEEMDYIAKHNPTLYQTLINFPKDKRIPESLLKDVDTWSRLAKGPGVRNYNATDEETRDMPRKIGNLGGNLEYNNNTMGNIKSALTDINNRGLQ